MTDTAVRRAGDDASTAWRIRPVEPAEYDAAGAVTAAAYEHDYGVFSAEYAASLRDVAGRTADGEVWVAVDDAGSILGTVWVARPDRPLSRLARAGETDFRQLAVAPAARRRGVGRALVDHVVSLAHERGSARVVMNSGPEMTGAHALYLALGFERLTEREGRIEVEPGRWVDLLSFGLDLEGASAPTQ